MGLIVVATYVNYRVKDEKGGSLNLRTMRSRSTGSISLKNIKESTDIVTQSPLGSSQTFESGLDEKQSFLKKEESSSPVEITIKRDASTTHRSSRFMLKRLSVFILLFLIGLLSLVFFIYMHKPFYQGSWRADISETEKSKGIKELSYVMDSHTFTEKLSSENEGLAVTATLVSNMHIVQRDSSILLFKRADRKIEDIQIHIPTILCQKTGSNCDEVKSKFEKTFQEEIEKQNQTAKETVFKVSRMNSRELKLESDIEGVRVLRK